MATIKSRAAVAFAPGEPLSIVEIDVEAPKAGEVLVRIMATALCHTDAYTLSGKDPEGVFPVVLGHEGVGTVEQIGDGVSSVRVGDVVIPLYVPECKACRFCLSGKTNLCNAIRATQGKGLMPDSTTRFSYQGKPLFHYMGCSTFSEYTVVPEIALHKVEEKIESTKLSRLSLLGCGVPTGVGAVLNTAKVEPNSSVAVFGLGCLGLAVVNGSRIQMAKQIIAIDTNPAKFEMAKNLGATHFINPLDYPDRKIQDVIVELTDGGVDYSFECIGRVETMRSALECTVRGWGLSVIIGVAGAGEEISTRPFQLVTGRRWAGTAYGGVKGRSELGKFISMYKSGEIPLDSFVTHDLKFEDINKAFHLLHSGQAIRAVLNYDDSLSSSSSSS